MGGMIPQGFHLSRIKKGEALSFNYFEALSGYFKLLDPLGKVNFHRLDENVSKTDNSITFIMMNSKKREKFGKGFVVERAGYSEF
jgi:hypothetical protein